MNNVSLMGRSTRDPEVRYTANTQVANARFVVVVSRELNKKKRQEVENNRYPIADLISCMAWGKTVENIGNYFHKGDRVAITGYTQTESYENQQGQRTYTTDVAADSFDFAESNSSSNATNQGYSDLADLNMSGQESFDSKLPFQVM